jgi:hypothetical protein
MSPRPAVGVTLIAQEERERSDITRMVNDGMRRERS